MADPAPERGGKDTMRRIRVRLSERRLDDARFLAALDQRTEAAGEIDHEFVRRCLINGFMLFERMNIDDQTPDLKPNGSVYTPNDATPASTAEKPSMQPSTGMGVRQLSGLMGGASVRNEG